MPARQGLRAAALLAAGGIALHQLRYAVGYGAASEEALAAHGHGYLGPLSLAAALLVALAAGQFVALLARPPDEGSRRRARLPLGHLWIISTLALLSVYAGQEVIEGLLAAGHPSGIAAVLEGGGAWALPLAAAVGLLVALVERGAELAIAARSSRARTPARRRLRAAAPPRADLLLESVLALNLAGRAPPIHSV